MTLFMICHGETTGNLQSTNCNVAVFRYMKDRWYLSCWNLAGNLEGESV